MAKLPAQYCWLETLGASAPKMIQEWIKIYDTREDLSRNSNPTIMGWAKELGVAGFYTDDSIPWCGLGMAIVAKRAGYEPPKDFLRALAWNSFGDRVHTAGLGDILTFKRTGGGHVGTYIGENAGSVFILNANASDKVGINTRAKMSIQEIRRPHWKIGQPASVKPYFLTAVGELASSEA